MSSTYYDTSYPPGLWDGRADADTGEPFFDSRVTAQDIPNASRLVGYGFIADPQTAWTTGQAIFINASMRFYWNGTTWLPGISATAEEPVQPQEASSSPPEPPVVPQEASDSPQGTETPQEQPEAPQDPAPQTP